MNIESTKYDGLKVVTYFRVSDARGVFVKPWIAEELHESFGNVAETYFSFSEKGVFRGLHYQEGVAAQKKFVVCLTGAIEDVALDLRNGSDTYGQVFRMRLDAMNGTGLIIPAGFAHGIFAYESSTIANFCDKPYAPGQEGGVNWKGLPDLDDLKVTTVSDKDAALPRWEGGGG